MTQTALKETNGDYMGVKSEEIEICLNKNNGNRTRQLVRDPTSEKHGRFKTV